MKSTPLRGRSESMTRVLSLVRGVCRGGAASAVVVWGPGGIGKSALLSQACREAGRLGARVAFGSCDRVGQVSPGAPVIAALRAGREPLAELDAYEQILQARDEPLLLVERIAAVLEAAAAAAPVVVAVDDVQWADQVSRFAIRMLPGRLAGLPIIWMFAARDEDAGLDLLGFEACRVESVRLGPLVAGDVTAMAMDRLGRVPDERTRGLLEAAGGNPLLAVQILDSLARAAARGPVEGVPLEFDVVIAQRLAELAEAPRDVATLVSVAARAVPLRDVVALLPQSAQSAQSSDAGWEAVLAAAVDSGLVEVSGEALVPRHDLVGQAVCAALPGETVHTWHRRLAEHYLRVGDVSAAAAHARSAVSRGDVGSALVLLTAAEQLAAILPEDAGELAALAFRSVRPDQPEWLEAGRRCLSVLCRVQWAGEAIGVADAILARVDDGDLAGAVETEAAQALWVSGRLDELLARTGPVLAAGRLDPGVSARLHAVRALAHTKLLAGDDAAREADAALEGARASGDGEAFAIALRAVGEAARNEGRHLKALRSFRELRLLTGTHCLAEEITSLQFLDRYGHAQTLLDEVRSARGETTGSILPALQCAQMWQDFNLGRSEEADAAARTLLDIGQHLGSNVYSLDAVIVQISGALLRGDAVTAAARLAVAEGLAGTDAHVREPGLTVMRGWLAACRGEVGAAAEGLRPVVEGSTRSCSYWPLWPCWMGLFFEIGTAADDQRFAQLVVDVAELAAARNPGVASFEGLALNVRARSKGDLDLLRESAAVLARSPRPLLRAFGADCLGRALLAEGDRAEALGLLDQAWDGYHGINALTYRAGVQQAMREAGVRRAKWTAAAAAAAARPDTGLAALTEAERRVTVLIAAGHTNRSAAAELGVSVNTVGTHLRQAFAKLGVQSRVQLANVLRGELSPLA